MDPVVNYKYIYPGPAGPFKGRVVWDGTGITKDELPKKGDQIYMIFGLAEVTSVRRPNAGIERQAAKPHVRSNDLLEG